MTRSKISKLPKRHAFTQILNEVIQFACSCDLSGTQYKLWLYLCILDPYGDRWVELPTPTEIAIALGIDPVTVKRAARRLNDCGLFEIDLKRWKARNTTLSEKICNFSTGKTIRKMTNRSNRRQTDPENGKLIHETTNRSEDSDFVLETLQDKASSLSHKNHTNPYSLKEEREIDKNQDLSVPGLLFFESTDKQSRKIAPDYDKWLRSKAKQLKEPPILIEQWIEAQSCIPANQRQFLSEQHSNSIGSKVPPPSNTIFFNEREVEQEIDWMLLGGSREIAYFKLRQHYSCYPNSIQTLCDRRSDWGFTLNEGQLNDTQQEFEGGNQAI
ncbi:MAG: hypothetical protein SFY66_26570 [Oculatellaceae cyanobacterium bins.114]|nr:hypothetical protein [Oculatellaceae cyanobacterium bins.114]